MKDINECIGDIGKAESTIFSTMDLTSGFWQLPLDKQSRPYTAFTVPGMGQYQYKVLAMGLKGGPGSFQRMMELTCKGLDRVIVYIDDLIVHTKDHGEHRNNLQKLFHRLRHYKLKLNIDKCFFGADTVSYLGYRLTPQGILPGSDKLLSIKNAKPPSSLSEVRAFLGLCNFFRSHVKRFATLAAPLIRLTSKEAGWRGPKLPDDAFQSFKALQDALVSEPVVKYPRSSLPYELYCDASTGGADFGGGYGAILVQRSPKNEAHVIAYASRALRKHEKNYTPFLAEMMCAVWAMNHFGVQLRGRKFKLFTDHKPLEKLGKTQTKSFNRLQEAMAEFDFDLHYYPGAEMPADFLSRQFTQQINSIDAVDFTADDIKSAQMSDPFCLELASFLTSGTLPPENARATLIKKVGPLVFQKNGVLFRKHIDPVTDMETSLLILPKSLVDDAVHRAHGSLLSGHGGIEKTKRRLLACYYWPNMQQDIKEALIACPRCQMTKTAKQNSEKLHPLPQCSSPNQRLHMDLFGPLKTPNRSKAYIMCMTDAFTKYVEVACVPDKLANTISQVIFDSWICRYGIPLEIVTDGGKEFCNKVTADLYERLRITHSVTSPAHPQCNAQAEVANKHFQKYLARMCENDTLHWEHLLPPMAFAYNTSVHTTTGLSPAFLLYGYNPVLPGLVPPSLDESDNNNRLQGLQRARDAAHEHSTRMANQYKVAHDKNSVPVVLSPGQQVLVDVRLFPNCNKKLANKYEGPYFVYKVHPKGVIDILKDNKIHRVNVDRVKPYIAPPPGFGELIPEEQTPPRDPFFSVPGEPQAAAQAPLMLPPPPVVMRPGRPQNSEEVPTLPPPVTEKRKPGRPRKTTDPPKPPQPYSGPTTRSKAQSPTNQQNSLSESEIMAAKCFRNKIQDEKVRKTYNDISYRHFIRQNPHLHNVKKLVGPIIYYGDNESRDEFGIPVTEETVNTPAYQERRRFLMSLKPATRNRLLTGDPHFSLDPIFYAYALTNPRLPVVRDCLPHLFPPDLPPPPPKPEPKGEPKQEVKPQLDFKDPNFQPFLPGSTFNPKVEQKEVKKEDKPVPKIETPNVIIGNHLRPQQMDISFSSRGNSSVSTPSFGSSVSPMSQSQSLESTYSRGQMSTTDSLLSRASSESMSYAQVAKTNLPIPKLELTQSRLPMLPTADPVKQEPPVSYVPQAGTWPPKPEPHMLDIPNYPRGDKRRPPSMVSQQGVKKRGITPQDEYNGAFDYSNVTSPPVVRLPKLLQPPVVPVDIPDYPRNEKRPPPSMVSRQGTKRRGVEPSVQESLDTGSSSAASSPPPVLGIPKLEHLEILTDLPRGTLPDWRNSPDASMHSYMLQSPNTSTSSNHTAILNPFKALRDHNSKLQRLEQEMEASNTAPMYDDIRAHQVSPKLESVPQGFISNDNNPPCFLPDDTVNLIPNVTRDWGHPLPIAEPDFEGQTVFSKRLIAPQLVPDTSRFEEIVSPASRARAEAIFPEQYFADRMPTSYDSSSSTVSAGSLDSYSSIAPPLPPRVPNRPRDDFELRPARFHQPEQKQGVLGYLKQKIHEEVAKEVQRIAEKKARKKDRNNS